MRSKRCFDVALPTTWVVVVVVVDQAGQSNMLSSALFWVWGSTCLKIFGRQLGSLLQEPRSRLNTRSGRQQHRICSASHVAGPSVHICHLEPRYGHHPCSLDGGEVVEPTFFFFSSLLSLNQSICLSIYFWETSIIFTHKVVTLLWALWRQKGKRLVEGHCADVIMFQQDGSIFLKMCFDKGCRWHHVSSMKFHLECADEV